MDLVTRMESSLPRLSWIAIVDLQRHATTVLHGRSVEATDRFVVEGAWGGSFQDGDFAGSPSFFGSGVAVRPQGLVVSPSRALVDRVFSCETGTGFLVSNSLSLMLFAAGATLDPGRSYQHETYTILAGIDEYDPTIPVRSSRTDLFRQHYHHPFVLGEGGLRRLEPPEPPHFDDYRSYVAFLRTTLASLHENSRDPARTWPLAPRLTLSRGYDSPAVAVLASAFTSVPAYTARRSNSLMPSWLDREARVDDGTPIAERLGLPVHRLKDGPPELDERLFLAGGTGDPELIFGVLTSDAHSDPHPTLLLTGYHGDKVWARDPGPSYETPDLRRGDTSGLALSEVRLWAGFVNVAVPFIGARGIESIATISQSSEMKRWSIGREYDRPIPRRIVEEAGIPRDWFGQRKRAVLQTHSLPVTPHLCAAFADWLEREIGMTLRRYRFLVRVGTARWAALRTLEKAAAVLGIDMPEPARWPWVPGGDPASLLYRWAVSTLVGADAPYPDKVRTAVMEWLTLTDPSPRGACQP